MNKEVFILSHGSYLLKAGFNHAKKADLIPKPYAVSNDLYYEHIYKCPLYEKNIFNELYPIENGLITDFDEMILIWDMIFDKMYSLDTSNTTIFIAAPLFQSKKSNERLMEILFERYGFCNFFIENQALLTMYALGKTSGLLIDSGYQSTKVIPIYNDSVYKEDALVIDIGGKDITDFLIYNLENTTSIKCCQKEYTEINKMKEALCFVNNEHNECLYLADKNELCMQYGNWYTTILDKGVELFRASEILFNPALIGRKSSGLSKSVSNVIKKFDATYNVKLEENIVCYGGNACLSGFSDRIYIDACADDSFSGFLNVTDCVDKKTLEWQGAQLLSNSVAFCDMVITQNEYSENGLSILKKCFNE
ncbi:hypothetical protein COBT_000521 [Conglomerata obtusa]